MRLFHQLFVVWLGLFSSSVFALYTPHKWGFDISAVGGAGTLEDSSNGLSSRWMSGYWAEATVGRHFGRVSRFLVGIHGDFRWLGQLTPVTDAGGTGSG